MEIKYIKTTELVPYANNTRTHDDKQVTQIASSIREFGFTNPVLVDEKQNIIAGHGRIMAAKKLKMDEVPCVVLEGLTDAQRKAYIIADNKLALNAGWDEDLLKIEIEGLSELDFDLSLLGFDDNELDDLLKEDIEVIEDDFEGEVPVDPVSKRGDVWTLGRHRLMCGDSVSDDVGVLLDGIKADMVFTDPPYGVSYQSNMRTKSEKFEVLENDNVLLDITKTLEKYSKGWMFIWTSWKIQNKWIELLNGFGYPSNMIIWFKGGGGMGDLKKTFISDYEVGLVWHRGANIKGKRIGSVWKIGKDSATKYIHPTQKPVELAYKAIEKTTIKNCNILDLFGGSGSTLIASEQLNRVCYMMELDEKYVDVIINRYASFKESIDDIKLLRDGKEYTYAEIFHTAV